MVNLQEEFRGGCSKSIHNYCDYFINNRRELSLNYQSLRVHTKDLMDGVLRNHISYYSCKHG